MSGLRICSIEIADTFGTQHAKFAPGTVTRIHGANGSGKSSILRALAYVFQGGTDPEVIRKGAEQSVVEMILSDGTKICKTTRPKRSRKGGEITGYVADLEITQPDGTPREAPKAYIDRLSEVLAVDPSILLRIDSTTVPGRKQLAAELMKLVPISFGKEEVLAACGIRSSMAVPMHQADRSALAEAPAAALDLDGLKKIHISVTENRRRIGQTRDDSDGAVNRLRKALPQDDGEDYSQRLAHLEETRLEIERVIADRRVEIERDKAAALKAAAEEWSAAVAAVNTEIDGKIRELEAERTRRNGEAKERQLAVNQAASEAEKACLAELTAEAQPEQEKVAGEIAGLREKIAGQERAATLRQELEIQLETCRQAHWQYDQLSLVLERLEKLRLDKLTHLPVGGLIVEEGVAYLDGIPWDKVNLARRVEAVLQICTQRSGQLPLLLIDDSEHLDSDTRAAIEQGLSDAGFQVIEAMVTDGPLSIESWVATAA